MPHALHTSSFIVTVPADAARPVFAGLNAIDCSPTGGCLAVGAYQGHREPFHLMAVMRTSGRWGRGFPLALPTTASPSSYAALMAVGCATPWDCLAVGTFTTSTTPSAELPMALFEVRGRWQPARPIVLPSGFVASSNGGSTASAVSCVALSCTIVGDYSPRTGGTRAFGARASFTGTGRLSRGFALPFSLPAALHGRMFYESLVGLDCTATTRCQAVGSLSSVDGSISVAITQAEAGGMWSTDAVAPLPTPAGPGTRNSWLRGVSCSAPTTCLAVGSLQTNTAGSSSSVSLVDSLGPSGWSSTTPPAPPAGDTAGLQAVGCQPSGQCVASGGLTLSDGSVEGAVDAGTAASLTSIVPVTLPVSPGGPPDIGGLHGISCPPGGSCVAAGDEALLDGHISVFDHPVITTISSS
jgi:hypothetical protein